MYIIEVCGNLYSGKTTLSKLISNSFNFEYVHAEVDETLIASFFDDVGKYFLQHQLSFILNKAMKIHYCIQNDINMVIDRSLYEDINIFAKYFMDNSAKFNISEKDKSIYDYISSIIYQQMPRAHLAIYCKASPEVCEYRQALRHNRIYEKLYPPNHIKNLNTQYEQTIYALKCKTLTQFDCNKYSLLDKNTRQILIEEIRSLMNNFCGNNQKLLTILKQDEK